MTATVYAPDVYVCVACHDPLPGDGRAYVYCAECRRRAGVSAIATADKHHARLGLPGILGPRSCALACLALARMRASEEQAHLAQPSADVRRRWRALYAAEGYAGTLAVGELLALLRRF